MVIKMNKKLFLMFILIFLIGCQKNKVGIQEKDKFIKYFNEKVILLGAPEIESIDDVFNNDDKLKIKKYSEVIKVILKKRLSDMHHDAAWVASYLGMKDTLPLLRQIGLFYDKAGRIHYIPPDDQDKDPALFLDALLLPQIYRLPDRQSRC